jgi:hypothetical protein
MDGNHRHPFRQMRGLRRDVDLHQMRAAALGHVRDDRGHRREVGLACRHPVQRGFRPVERAEGQRFGLGFGPRARTEAEEGGLHPVVPEPPREVHRVPPDAARGVDRHEKPCHARSL